MTELELFAAHGLAYPTSAQIAEIWWTQRVGKPVADNEQAPDDSERDQAQLNTAEAFA